MNWQRLRRPLMPFILGWVAMAFARVYFSGATVATFQGIAVVIGLTSPLAILTVAYSLRKERGRDGGS